MPAEVTSFIGRAVELDHAHRLLDSARLVTCTGVGGVGKTRLALKLTGQVKQEFADGVAFVDLSELDRDAGAAHSDLLFRSVAHGVGLRDSSPHPPLDVLTEYFRSRNTLLVLDNCEHVADQAGALIGVLLRRAPRLKIIATSRHRLKVQGEHTLLVHPLPVPDPQDSKAGTDDSLALLVDRAAAAGFEISPSERLQAIQLCQRLEGVPLAIELAAARLGTLSLQDVLAQLDAQWVLSGGGPDLVQPYHRSLRATVEWSWGLCGDRGRVLWSRLAVFSGGFDLTAAQQVCQADDLAEDEVPDALAQLVEQSIVVAHRGERQHRRYRMLESLRDYGWERLRDSGTETAVRDRHVAFYQALLSRAAQRWYGSDEVQWLTGLRHDLQNVRAALDYCRTRDRQRGLELAIASVRVRLWEFSGDIGEGRQWLERLSALEDQPLPLVATATALAAWYASVQGDPAANVLLEKTQQLAKHGASAANWALWVEGVHAFLVDGSDHAFSLLGRAHDQFASSGAPETHMATLFLALWSAFFGSEQQAMQLTAWCQRETERTGAGWATSWSKFPAAVAHLLHGDLPEARRLAHSSLSAQRDIGDLYWGGVWGVALLGWIAAAEGHHERAALLLGASAAQQDVTGVRIAGLQGFRQANDQALQQARTGLGEQRFATEYDHGRQLSDYRSAIDLALAPPERKLLTHREQQVATLVAQGMSNKEIGHELYLSPRTVERHIHNTAAKLERSGITTTASESTSGTHHRARMLLAAWAASTDASE